MNHMDFFNRIKTKIDNSYVFIGQEEFVKNKALKDLKDLCIGESSEEFNFTLLNEDASILQLYEACETLPFMANKRLVVYKNPKVFLKEMSKEDLELLSDTLSNIKDHVCLVIYISSLMDKRKKLFKLLSSFSTVVEFDPLDEFSAVRWIGSNLKKQGIAISLKDAQILCDMVGTNLFDLNSEIQKLISYIGDRKEITQKDFVVVKDTNINFDVFNMINSFLCGDKAKGINQFYKLILSGNSGFLILGAIASKFRSYYNAKNMLINGVPKATIIKQLGGGYGAKKAVEECSKITFEQIKKVIDTLEYADYAIKNGLMKEKVAVEYVLFNAF